MAYCTKCGLLMNDADMETHVCIPSDIPEKGKPVPKGKSKLEVL